MKNTLAFAAVGLAVVSLMLHAFRGSDERTSHARGQPELEVAVAALAERVTALEARIDALPRADAPALASTPGGERVPVGRDEATDARIAELIARLEKLERDSAAALAKSAENAGRQATGAGPPVPVRLGLDEATVRARNLSASEQERLQGLRSLRGQRLPDETDARLPVLDDMIELGRASQNGDVRADVWRQLHGVTDRRLLQPLLYALSFDTHANARNEAAETLGDFLPDPSVESALRHAAANDADDGVRRQAKRSLQKD